MLFSAVSAFPGAGNVPSRMNAEAGESMNVTARKAALITGAARGIGLAAAKRFLADGWRVALLDIDGATLARTHAALPAEAAIAIDCDVADPDGVAAAVAKVSSPSTTPHSAA